MEDNTASAESQHAEVMAKLINVIRRWGYSIRTEQAYLGWVTRFIAFLEKPRS